MLKETMNKRKDNLIKYFKEELGVSNYPEEREAFYVTALLRFGYNDLFSKGKNFLRYYMPDTDHWKKVNQMSAEDLNLAMHQIHIVQPSVRQKAEKQLKNIVENIVEESENFVGKEIHFEDRKRHLFDGGDDKDILAIRNKLEAKGFIVFNGITYSNTHIDSDEYCETGLIDDEKPFLKIYGKNKKGVEKVVKLVKEEFKNEELSVNPFCQDHTPC